MAKLKSGILGGISGTIGNIIGGNWRGIDYIRSKPANVKDRNTEAQQNQRKRFRIMITFLKKAKVFVNIGFRNSGRARTPINAAMSKNIKEAVSGVFPDISLDPSKLILAEGNLFGARNYGMDLGTAGSAIITWTSDTSASGTSADDIAMILLYNSVKQEVVMDINTASRSAESATLAIPAGWSGENVAGYLAFRSPTGKEVSDSIFLGENTAG